MKFAHGEAFHTKLDGFTNQDPDDMLNLSNETHMTESMGEISAIAFSIKDRLDPKFNPVWNLEVDCVDIDDNETHSSQTIARRAIGVWYNPTQSGLPCLFPVGEVQKGVDTVWKTAVGTSFDWRSVKEVRFVIGGRKGAFDVLFDAFRFVKPLIANAVYLSGEPREKSCRSVVVAKEKIIDYESALLIAKALLEQQKKPNTYWDIENLGRVDIPSGSKFKIGTLELLMRDERWSMTKEGGWTISGRALEQT
jgi:hypothetical protein